MLWLNWVTDNGFKSEPCFLHTGMYAKAKSEIVYCMLGAMTKLAG